MAILSVSALPRRFLQRRCEWLLHPQGLARSRIERLDQADCIGRVQNAVDHDRRAVQVVRRAQIRKFLHESCIHARARPGDPQVTHVAAVDLTQRRIAIEVLAASEIAPLP